MRLVLSCAAVGYIFALCLMLHIKVSYVTLKCHFKEQKNVGIA